MDIDFLDAVRGFQTSLTLQRRVECETCHGAGTKPGSTPTTCPECGGAGSKPVVQGPLQFRVTCPRCKGSGQLPGDPCTACGGTGRIAAAGNDAGQYPARRRAWKADSPARKRRGRGSRRTGRRSLHRAANPAASDTDAIGQRLVHGAANHCRRGCQRCRY